MSLYSWLKDISGVFQPTYDRIKAWKLPPKIDELFDEVWKNLPSEIQNAIWTLLKKIVDKYGEDVAIIILNNLLNGIKNNAWIIKK